LIYERATVFERGLSADFLAHDVIPSSMDTVLLAQAIKSTIIFWIVPQYIGSPSRANGMFQGDLLSPTSF
jgi:hypothetical protein